jgi:steroid delta-isomerase-like uncharacterized protein
VVNQGKDQLKAFGAAFIAAVPDLRMELTESFATDDGAGMEWLLSGMRRGDLPGIPATNEPVSLRGCTICELRSGRIQRNSDYRDMATFLEQIGVYAKSSFLGTSSPTRRRRRPERKDGGIR